MADEKPKPHPDCIVVDARAWTGVEDEGPPPEEVIHVFETAPRHASAQYMMDAIRLGRRRNRRMDFYLLAAGVLLGAGVGAYLLLAATPRVFAERGLAWALIQAVQGLALAATVPLGAAWMWRFIGRVEDKHEARRKGLWETLVRAHRVKNAPRTEG